MTISVMVANLPILPRRSVFYAKEGHVGFVMEVVTQGQEFCFTTTNYHSTEVQYLFIIQGHEIDL